MNKTKILIEVKLNVLKTKVAYLKEQYLESPYARGIIEATLEEIEDLTEIYEGLGNTNESIC